MSAASAVIAAASVETQAAGEARKATSSGATPAKSRTYPRPGHAGGPETVLHVSLKGDDRFTGRLAEPAGDDGPFATIGRAQEAVRALVGSGSLKQDVRVVIHGGTYFQPQPLAFGPESSGPSFSLPVNRVIIYAAAPGERVVLSGGRRITGFRKESVNGRHAWVADVPRDFGPKRGFRYLWVNGRRAERPRLPATGYFLSGDLPHSDMAVQDHLVYRGNDLQPWHNIADVELYLFRMYYGGRASLASVDPATRVARFTAPCMMDLRFNEEREQPAYWVENVFEELKEPGQWYHDRTAGRLYYLPRQGEIIETAEVIAPVLPEVMRVQGTAQHPVENLWFEDLAFSHTQWDFPDGVAGDTDSGGEIGAAVELRHAERCIFHHCAFEHVGAYGIQIGDGCLETEVSACHLWDLGAGGVKIGTGSERATIEDNRIHDGGHFHANAVGIWAGDSPANRIRHNEVFGLNYSGLQIGNVSGYGRRRAYGNIIESNHVHHQATARMFSDMGGIYIQGVTPGSRIRYNLVHDIRAREYGTCGIYLDEGGSDILVDCNVCYACDTSAFYLNHGYHNEVYNNVFAGGKECAVSKRTERQGLALTVEHNIVLTEHGKALGCVEDWPNYQTSSNIYWDADGAPLVFAGKTFAQWQEDVTDAGSIVADPRVTDAKHGDFRLRPGSPAPAIGFAPFDLSDVGPRVTVGPRLAKGDTRAG